MNIYFIESDLPLFPKPYLDQLEEQPFKYGLMIQADSVRDEYHSMEELYDHRMALNAALFSVLEQIYEDYPNIQVFKARLHYDGTMLDGGYFIVVACFHDGKNQISYHYKLEHWDKFKIPEFDRCPYPYDGHTSNDVIERLLKI